MWINIYSVILPYFFDMKNPQMSKILPVLSVFQLGKNFRVTASSQKPLLGIPANVTY